MGLAVFLGQYDYLIDHMVMPGQLQSVGEREAVIEMLKDRLKPVPRSAHADHKAVNGNQTN